MKRLIFLCTFAAFLAAGCPRAPQLVKLESPDEVPNIPIPTIDREAYAAKYSSYDGVFLNIDETIEHSGSKNMSVGAALFGSLGADWTYSNVYKCEYLILNPEDDDLAGYSIGFKPDKFYIRVSYPDGTVKFFGTKDLQEYKTADGDKDYKIAFPNVKKGTIVTIGYEFRYDVAYWFPPLEHDIPLQFTIPCEKLSFTYAYPNWWTIQIKNIGPNRSIPVQYRQDEKSRKTLMVYEATDIPALQYEPYAPPYKQVAKYLNFRVTYLKMEDIKPELVNTWDEVAKRFRKYAIKKSEKESKQVNAVADSLIAGKITQDERLKTIVEYVSKNIIWYPEGNDGDPGKTLKLKRGNIYDITGLARNMLSHAGIDSDYLLVHDAYNGYFDASFISVDQVQVPALLAHLDNRVQIVFPASVRLPVGQVPDFYQDQPTVIVSDESFARQWKIPVDTTEKNILSGDFQIAIDSNGMVGVKQRRTYQGSYAYRARFDIRNVDRNEVIDSLKSALHFPGADLTVNSLIITNDSLIDQPFIVDYDYTIGNLVMTTPQEMVLQSADLMTSMVESILSMDTTARQNPVWVGFTRRIEQTFAITAPAGWITAALPEPINIENEFGTLTCTSEQTSNGILLKQVITLKRSLQPREKYGALLELIGKNSRSIIDAIVFKPA